MKKIIKTAEAPLPIGPYNQAVKIGGFLFVSGQVAIDPKTNKMIKGSLEEEIEQVLKNIEAILIGEDLTFENVVKSTIFLTDMSDYPTVNQIYGKRFSNAIAPARETIAAAGLPANARLEISVIAHD